MARGEESIWKKKPLKIFVVEIFIYIHLDGLRHRWDVTKFVVFLGRAQNLYTTFARDDWKIFLFQRKNLIQGRIDSIEQQKKIRMD